MHHDKNRIYFSLDNVYSVNSLVYLALPHAISAWYGELWPVAGNRKQENSYM